MRKGGRTRGKEKWFEMDDSRKLSQKFFGSPAISSKFVFFFPSPKHFNFWFLSFLFLFWCYQMHMYFGRASELYCTYVWVGVVYSVRKGGGEKMGERKKPPVRQPSRVRDRIGGRRTMLWTGRVIKSIPTEKRKKEKVYLSAKMSPHRPQSIISVERVCLCHCSLLAMWWC